MPIKGDELMDAAEIIARERNFHVSLKHSLMGGAVTGLTTVGGGLALGPAGLALGGFIGGIMSYLISKDTFKPLHEIIANDLTPKQRQQLINHLRAAIVDVDMTDVIKLTSFIMSNASLQEQLACALLSFAQQELSLTVVQ